ncbi:MAG: class IV adenylate cyclase [Desulfovibrionales bacterium]|jgi:adenylate cyclase class 2|nr:class IV adenylate cyclase [Desulfovibrionales bacterium]
MIEHEVKFILPELMPMHQLLSAQATLLVSWHLEKNTLYDYQGILRSQGKLLRLRQREQKSTLTFKGPVFYAQENIKSRQEVECDLDTPQNMEIILLGLGYSVSVYYEKFRSIWSLGQGTVYLDLLPFGKFLEIEGGPEDIPNLAQTLGLDPKQALAQSYLFLYDSWCKKQGCLPETHIAFEPAEKIRLTHLLMA